MINRKDNRRTDRGRDARDTGFTLLEMLAATAMVALLAGSLYVSLRVAFKARRTAVVAVEDVRRSNQTLDLFKADLESAVIPVTNSLLAGPFVGTSGGGMMGAPLGAAGGAGSDQLSFYATAMDIEPGPGVGDVKKIDYSCELAGTPPQLSLIRWVTTNLLAPTTPVPKQEILCRGLRSFVLRYYDGFGWQESWDSTAQGSALPMAVEVDIEWDASLKDSGAATRNGPRAAGPRLSHVIWIPCGQPATQPAASGGTATGGGTP